MTFLDGALLFIVAIVAGAQNAVAGGGSFYTFPTLLFLGMPAVAANATNTVALWPGSIAGTAAYRRELMPQGRRLILLSIVSCIGGYLGAELLLSTSDDAFRALIPWLLLTATVVFAFGNTLVSRLRKERLAATEEGRSPSVTGMVAQFAISVYGGFFGGGIGILMLAALTLTGMKDIHAMNGLKNWLATCINGVAVVAFVVAGTVYWPEAILMLVGAVIGGYSGASLSRKLNPKHVRAFVVVVGTILTAYFFVDEYTRP